MNTNTNIKILLGFIGGLLVGGSSVYFFLNDKYQKIAQEEINEYRYKYRKLNRYNNEESDINVEDDVNVSEEEYSDIAENDENFDDYTSYFKDEMNEVSKKTNDKDFDMHMADREYPEEDAVVETYIENDFDDKPIIHQITAEEMLDEYPLYSKLTYTYYEDGVLADDGDNELSFEEIEELVGSDFDKLFDSGSDVGYIRNYRFGCDIEICRDFSEYHENGKDDEPNISIS